MTSTNPSSAARPKPRQSSVPRALREKVAPLLEATYAFMDSRLFKQRDVEAQLFGPEGDPRLPATSWYQPTREDAFDETVLERPQLMDASEERLMFLRFNYAKLRLGRLQRMIKREGLDAARASEFLEWHRRFEHYREFLVRTNLALVLAMAKRTRLGEVDYAEVVSEGNMALVRAVDKFNVDRGYKFSTYACRAILKAFSRVALKASRRRARFSSEFEPDVDRTDWKDRRRDEVEADCIDELKVIVERNLAELSSVEETVIRRRFNWEQKQEYPMTLEEVGRVVGYTKERVRQIQNAALAKIRGVMEIGVLRTRQRALVTVE